MANYQTVDNLFVKIKNVFLNNNNTDSIKVTYAPRLGFSWSILIDYDFNLADEEISIVISQLSLNRKSITKAFQDGCIP